MGRKLVIKNADFSVNGILNPAWQLDYTSLADSGSFVFCAPFSTGSSDDINMFGINASMGLTIKFIELTVDTTETNYTIPTKVAAYKIDPITKVATKIKEFDYTISGDGQSMVLIFDAPVTFDNCYLGLYCYDSTPGDMTNRALLCGGKNLSTSVDYVGYILGPITFDAQGDGTFTSYSTAFGFAGYCPQVRIG